MRCRKCASSSWKLIHCRPTTINLINDSVQYSDESTEDIRCAVCGLRATIEEHATIRTSSTYKKAMDPDNMLTPLSPRSTEIADDILAAMDEANANVSTVS